MKAVYELITHKPENSFSVRQFSLPSFDGPFHFHPEIELTFIENSSGTRYVGGKVSDYEPGDLVILGKDIPHCWHSTTSQSDSLNPKSIVFHFRPEFLGETFLNLGELTMIRFLLERRMRVS